MKSSNTNIYVSNKGITIEGTLCNQNTNYWGPWGCKSWALLQTGKELFGKEIDFGTQWDNWYIIAPGQSIDINYSQIWQWPKLVPAEGETLIVQYGENTIKSAEEINIPQDYRGLVTFQKLTWDYILGPTEILNPEVVIEPLEKMVGWYADSEGTLEQFINEPIIYQKELDTNWYLAADEKNIEAFYKLGGKLGQDLKIIENYKKYKKELNIPGISFGFSNYNIMGKLTWKSDSYLLVVTKSICDKIVTMN